MGDGVGVGLLDRDWRISPDAWRAIGVELARSRVQVDGSRSRQMWAIGDWLAAGEEVVFKSLKKARVRSMAAEITGYSRHTLVMAVSVARKVEPSIRIDGLSWWHHLVVAKLPGEEQSLWLTRAAEEGWSVPVLRERMSRDGADRSPVSRRTRRLISQLVRLRGNDIDGELLAQLHQWWHQEVQSRSTAAGEANHSPAAPRARDPDGEP